MLTQFKCRAQCPSTSITACLLLVSLTCDNKKIRNGDAFAFWRGRCGVGLDKIEPGIIIHTDPDLNPRTGAEDQLLSFHQEMKGPEPVASPFIQNTAYFA